MTQRRRLWIKDSLCLCTPPPPPPRPPALSKPSLLFPHRRAKQAENPAFTLHAGSPTLGP